MSIMYVCVPIATFLYIVVDVYSVVASLQALVRSVSFWLLWTLFTVLNGISFVLLKAALHSGGAGPAVVSSSDLLILFFSTIGTFSIIQSFSLKFANYKAIDLEQLFDRLRSAVLSEAAVERAGLDRNRKLRLAKRLTTHYNLQPASIDSDYALAAYTKRTPAQIAADIAQAEANPGGKIPTLVNRMVFTDERGARQFLP